MSSKLLVAVGWSFENSRFQFYIYLMWCFSVIKDFTNWLVITFEIVTNCRLTSENGVYFVFMTINRLYFPEVKNIGKLAGQQDRIIPE